MLRFMRFIVVDETGERYIYDATGPQDALERHYALDNQGEQRFVVGVYRQHNGLVGALKR
jgi:hypothetical protein